MAVLLFANNATTTLAGAITNTATTAELAAGSGTLFPNPGANEYFVMTFTDQATGLLNEIVWVTGRSGDTITMIRGKEGTTAKNWLAGDIAAELWTAGQAAAMLQQGQAQFQESNYALDTGVADAYVATFDPPLTAYVAGMPMRVKIANTNTGPCTLNAGPGAIPIKRRNGSDPAVNEIPEGFIATFIYDGASAQIADVPGRIQLADSVNYYVATTGNDSNPGSAASPWATLQHAWDYVQQNLDLNGFSVTIHVADGTYAHGVNAVGTVLGQVGPFNVYFLGNNGAPANCIINPTSEDCFAAANGASFGLSGFKTVNSGPGNFAGIAARTRSSISFNQCEFGTSNFGHVFAANGSFVQGASYSISGGAPRHWICQYGGNIIVSTTSVNLSGSPAFSVAFAAALTCATIQCDNITFSGTATGSRYSVNANGVIDTRGGGASYLPGSSAGAAGTGGQYV